MTITIMQRK